MGLKRRGIHTSICDDACCAATFTHTCLHWALIALLRSYEHTYIDVHNVV